MVFLHLRRNLLFLGDFGGGGPVLCILIAVVRAPLRDEVCDNMILCLVQHYRHTADLEQWIAEFVRSCVVNCGGVTEVLYNLSCPPIQSLF